MGWMWGGLAVLAAIGLLFALFVLSRGPHYRRMFAEPHFVEFAQKVADLKPRVLAKVERLDDLVMPDPQDVRTFVTSAGIFLFYTITDHGDHFEHHFSLRDRQGYTAHAVGGTFAVFTAVLLGIDPSSMRIERSENAVYHGIFFLDADQQAIFVERPVRAVTEQDVREMHGALMRLRDRVGFDRIETGIRFGEPLPKGFPHA